MTVVKKNPSNFHRTWVSQPVEITKCSYHIPIVAYILEFHLCSPLLEIMVVIKSSIGFCNLMH